MQPLRLHRQWQWPVAGSTSSPNLVNTLQVPVSSQHAPFAPTNPHWHHHCGWSPRPADFARPVLSRTQSSTSEDRRSREDGSFDGSNYEDPRVIGPFSSLATATYDAYLEQQDEPPQPPQQQSLPSPPRTTVVLETSQPLATYDAYLEQQNDLPPAQPQPVLEPVKEPEASMPAPPPLRSQQSFQTQSQPRQNMQQTPPTPQLQTPPSPEQQPNQDLTRPMPMSVAQRSLDTAEILTDVEVDNLAPGGDWFTTQDDVLIFAYSVLIGGVVATSVFFFDVLIQSVHDIPDVASSLGFGGGRATGLQLGTFGAIPFRCAMPVMAGFLVAWLQTCGFSPPLKSLVRAIEGVVDDKSRAALPDSYWQVARKAVASAITLGSGASLGPEAPSVELGANTAAVIMPKHLNKRRKRMLVAAGAAAGVSAAFDAPVTGALFATEFVLKSSRLGLDRLSIGTVFVSTSVSAGVVGFLRAQGQALGISGAGTHLIGRIPYFSIQPNMLYDVLQFSALGVGCAAAATALYEGVRLSEIALRPFPRWVSAPTAGAVCGLLAYEWPQVQYGYINLEEVFRGTTNTSITSLVALLAAKVLATSVCVGGGLVGGLFAPSLFIGAIVGNIMGQSVSSSWGLSDPTSFIVVGAAAVLGASCRAPLTAMALMVEITRDTGLLVPLLSAIGMASLLADYAEGIFTKKLETALLEAYLKERTVWWGAAFAAEQAGEKPIDTVEQVMASAAKLYVRHTLPLQQAKEAMVLKNSPAAVVVDDNFGPMGVVYLEDVETELVRKKMLLERDDNFNRS